MLAGDGDPESGGHFFVSSGIQDLQSSFFKKLLIKRELYSLRSPDLDQRSVGSFDPGSGKRRLSDFGLIEICIFFF